MAAHYGKLEEVDAMIDAYVNTDDERERARYFRAALAGVEAVLREAADRARRLREVR